MFSQFCIKLKFLTYFYLGVPNKLSLNKLKTFL